MIKDKNLDQDILSIIKLFNNKEYDNVINRSKKLFLQYNQISVFPNLIGASYAGKNDHEEAIKFFKKAIEIEPLNYELYNNIGKSLFKVLNFEDAIKAFEKSLKMNKNIADTYLNLGLIYKEKGDLKKCIDFLEQSIIINDSFFQSFYNLGLVFQEERKYKTSISYYQKAIDVNKKYFKAYNNLATIFIDLENYTEATEFLNKALEIKPDYEEAINNLGIIELEKKNYFEALNYFNKVLEINQNHIESLTQKIFIEKKICFWNNFDNYNDYIKKINDSDLSVTPWQLLSFDDDPHYEHVRARKYSKRFVKRNITITQTKKNKIKIGYFTPDFFNHAGMINMRGIFENFNRDRFEIVAFDYGINNNDKVHNEIKGYFNEFNYVNNLSDEEISKLAREKKIDIAIHRNGFSQNSRNNIFAHRAAPTQVSYLGYPGTTSLNFIDYIIADQIVIPEKNIKYFSEKIVFMPDSYYPTDNTRIISSKKFNRSEFNIPEDAFVYCSFNNSYKISPIEFDIWMNILLETKDTFLILLASDDLIKNNLKNEIIKRNIKLERVKFCKNISNEDHLSRHSLADLYLDTFNYNGHTSMVDALWSGLPAITKIGKSFTARVGASLLNSFNMNDFITKSPKEYQDLAIKLSHDKSFYQKSKNAVKHNIINSSLFDTKNYIKNLETAYEIMYQTKLQNNPLKNINL